MNRTFSVLSLAATAAVLAIPAISQATVISHESFTGYTAGQQLQSAGSVTVPGYTGNWTGIDWGNAKPVVQSGSLSYPGPSPLAFTDTGDKVGVPYNVSGGEITQSNSGRVYRALDSTLAVDDTTTGTRYLSFFFQSGQETGATSYQALGLFTDPTSGALTADKNRYFDLGIFGGDGLHYAFSGVSQTAQSTGVHTDSAVHLLVAKFNLSNQAGQDSVTVWVDPTAETGGTTLTGQDFKWKYLCLSDYDGNSASWDGIRWTDQFSDIVTVPEPASFGVLGLAALCLVRRRRPQ